MSAYEGILERPTRELPFVMGELNYLAAMVERPRNFTYEPPKGAAWSNIVRETRRVPIYDMRPIAGAISLDREGFELIGHKSAVRDFWNEEEVRSVYYPEAERLLMDVLGASRVFIFDHTMRRHVVGTHDRAKGAPRQPSNGVHVDHTAKSGPQRIRDFLGEEAEELLKGRAQVINVWRPIKGPLRDWPLTVCDASTVAPEDLVASDLVYRDRVGETYGVRFNDDHRWYYVSEMQPDEALLLKCFDSETDGRARFMPHTAFADPTVPEDAMPRESIELRTFVFHEK
jgi:hypothetical protein